MRLQSRSGDELRWPVFPLLGLTQDFPMRLEEFVDDGHLVVRAELPGIDPDKDIHVVVDEGLLTITGERRRCFPPDPEVGMTSAGDRGLVRARRWAIPNHF